MKDCRNHQIRVSARRLLGSVTAFVVLAASLTSMSGCQPPKQAIDAGAINVPLRSILDRHDQYILRDPSLSDLQKETFARSSQLVRKTLDTALQVPANSN